MEKNTEFDVQNNMVSLFSRCVENGTVGKVNGFTSNRKCFTID